MSYGRRYKNTNRRDDNDKKEILPILKELSLPFVQLLPGQGADYVVTFPSGVKIVEVKKPGKEDDLTQSEREMCDKVNETCPGSYVIVTCAMDIMILAGVV